MKDLDNKTYLFEKAAIPKAVLALCVPTILSSLVMVFYGLADTYFVGMLNDPLQNAAVTLANPMLMMYNAVTALFGVGSSSLISRALGSKNYEQVKRSSATGIFLAIFSGILFTLAFTFFKTFILSLLGADAATINATSEYLKWTVTLGAVPSIFNITMAFMIRSEGAAIHASIGTMCGCFLNILLDPIFILPFGLNMGVAGAGCATFISNCAASVYFIGFLYFKRKETYISLSPSKITLTKNMLFSICSVGIPAMAANLLTVTSQVILNNFTAIYGSSAVAAMGIAMRIDTIPLNIGNGLSSGIMPVIGYNYASGNVKRMKEALMFTIKCAVSFIGAVALIYFIFAQVPVSWFISNQEVIDVGAGLLRGLCIALPFYCFDSIAAGVFQACGFGRYSLLFTIARQVCLMIPLIFILDFFFPLYGLAYSYFVSEVVLSFFAFYMLRQIFKQLEKE